MLAVLHASQLVTLAGPERPRVGAELSELSIIPDGAMLVDEGRIVAIGPSAEIGKQISATAETIDAAGKTWCCPVSLMRTPIRFSAGIASMNLRCDAKGATYEEIAASGGGIRSTVRKTRAATEDELLRHALKHAHWFLQSGTTTVEAKSGYGLSVEDELKLLRVIRRLNAESPIEFIPTFLGAHAVPEEFRNAKEQYVALVIHEMLPRVAEGAVSRNTAIFFVRRGYFEIADCRKDPRRGARTWLAITHACRSTD